MRSPAPFAPRRMFVNVELRIALTSFMVLFLELALIRWLGAYVLHLAYFSNIVLLGSFFGIGIGFMLVGRRDIFRVFPYFLLLTGFVVLGGLDISFDSSMSIVFQELSPFRSTFPFWLVAPAMFMFVAAVFLGPAQLLGTLFKKTTPLTAYFWDVVGSIAGIGAFALLSASGAGPIAWFAVIAAAYALLRGADLGRDLMRDAGIFVLHFALLMTFTSGTVWSPYYKLVVAPIGDAERPEGYTLYANDTGHQTMERPENKEWVYHAPYDFFSRPSYKDVLVIGAGSGSDVALALQKGAAHVDAVDIDPVIVELGRRLHPSRPYDDPRVTVTIADGRTFLERSDKKYDLVIFALTDSLALASSYSNTRLESYLFTQRSIDLARQRLADGGLLVLYNYYREAWLVDKLAGMLGTSFGRDPYIVQPDASDEMLTAMMAGPKLADLLPGTPPSVPIAKTLPAATDDWPFLYLKRPSFPGPYAAVVAIIAAIAIFVVRALRPAEDRKRPFPWHFFFLGAGFLLLETKNVVNFQLLFGATWLVNALVFIAILALVLAAVLVTRRGWRPRQDVLYACLAATLVLNLVVPLSALAALPAALRYLSASLLTLCPVFFANLVFSGSFAEAERPNDCFAANLLGAMIGGLSEYAAMLIGYHWLVVVALAFYAASWTTAAGRRTAA